MIRTLRVSFVLAVLAGCPSLANAWNETYQSNWPNFRGPAFNGSSSTANPPTQWSEDKNVRWKVELPGPGNNSSPIIWNDRVYVLTAVPQSTGRSGSSRPSGGNRRGAPRVPLVPTKFFTLCYDRQTGKELWRKLAVERTPTEGHHPDHGFASASPFTDGKNLFAHFGTHGLYCYDMDGNLQWSRTNFGEMQTRGGFGQGSTPVLHGDTIVIPWDHEGPSWVMAIDRHTGETKWKKDRDEPSSWVTPLVVNANGRDIVVVGGQNYCRGYDLETGDVVWRGSGTSFRPTSGPVVIDNLVIVASNRRSNFLGAFQFDGKGYLNDNGGLAWHQTNSAPDVPSMVLSENRLYYIKGNTNIFSCNDARSGDEIYADKRLDGIRGVYASPVTASGKVIVFGRGGNAVVLEDGEEYKVLATNQLDDRIDATPALAGNDMIVRGKRYLYCISEDN